MNALPLASPYRGLAPFEDTETDARLFFGRERERRLILANLMASRLTVLYGASGVGKSSLLGAGVAHELGKTDNVAVLRAWADDPLAALAAIADRVEGGGDLYVILDQLEEFFVYHGTDGPASELASTLAELLQRRDVRVSALLGVREESLAKLDAFKPRLPNVLANYLRLEHLERDAARAAITEPLRRFEELGGEHWLIEAALVETVLDEVSAGKIDGGAASPGRIETPYLQLVMQRLWEAEREEGSTVLRLATLRKLGGAERIVREHLDRALETLTPAEQDAAARMFNHLVTPSGAKIAHDVDDLVSYAGVGSAAALGVITRLEGERIVRPVEDGRVEIYHDVLGESISTWRRDHEAMREVRRARRRARRLAGVAAGSVAALLLMSVVAVYALSQRREARERAALARAAATQAFDAKQDAEDERRNALRLKKAADRARKDAVLQATKADRSEGKARDALELAKKNERQANANAADAAQQQANAEASATEANQQKAEAQRQEKNAQNQKALAVENAAEAKRLKRKADASAEKAEQQAAKAKRQKDLARSNALVLRSATKLGSDPEQSVRLASEASRLNASEAAENALRDALAAFRLNAVFQGSAKSARAPAFQAATRPLRIAIFSPDNPSRYVLTSAAGGEVRIFSVRSRELVRSLRPRAEVIAASFSSDARMIVGGALDDRALLWSVDTGALLKVLPHPGAVNTADFTPDGKSVVTGGADGVVRVWDTASGILLRQIDVDAGPVRSVSLQPRGRLAVVVTKTDTARVIDVVTGAIVANLDRPGGITIAAFSPRGDVLAAGGAVDAYLWDARSWQLEFTLTGHTSAITDIAFSPDNRRVMTTSADTTARLWAIATGKTTITLTGWHQREIVSGAINPRNAGDTYATASADGTAGLWINDYLPHAVVLAGHGGGVTHVAFSSDGFTVLTASEDGNARLWRARDPELTAPVADAREPATQAAFDPSGQRLVTTSAGGTGRLYTTGGKLVKTFGVGTGVTDIAYSKSGWFATAGEDGNARLWRPDGSPAATLAHGARIRTVAMTTDGRLVATGGEDGRAVVFDRSGNVVRELGQGAVVTSVAFASSETLISAGADGSVKVLSVRDGSSRSLPSHRGAVADISVGPRGLVATASDDRTVHVYNVRTGQLVRTLQGHPAAVNVVVFSPDGLKLLAASTNGEVRTWDTKEWIGRVLEGRRPPEIGAQHTGAINGARFSPDSRWIVTAGPTAPGVWQTSTGDLLYFIRGPQNPVRAVTFAPDNRLMLSAGGNGTMRSYRCDLCGELPKLQKLAQSQLALAASGR